MIDRTLVLGALWWATTMIPITMRAQPLLDHKIIEQEHGLHSRFIYKIVRNKSGYFYLFMPHFVQRYDGHTFEAVHIPLYDKLPFPLEVSVLHNDEIVVLTDEGQGLFRIPHNSLHAEYVKAPPLHHFIVINDTLYLYKTVDDSTSNVQGCFYSLAGKRATHLPCLDFVPSKALYCRNDWYFFDHTAQKWYDTRLHTYIDGDIFCLRDTLYRSLNHQLQKRVDERWRVIFHCPKHEALTVIFADKKAQCLLGCRDRPRHYTAYYLYKDDSAIIHQPTLSAVNSNIIGVYADDLNYKLFLYGYTGIDYITIRPWYVRHFVQRPIASMINFGKIIIGLTALDDDIYFIGEDNGFYRIRRPYRTVDTLYTWLPNAQKHYANNFRITSSPKSKAIYILTVLLNTDTTYLHRYTPHDQHIQTKLLNFYPSDIAAYDSARVLAGGRSSFLSNEGKLVLYDFTTDDMQTIPVDLLVHEMTIHSLPQRRQFWIGAENQIVVLDSALHLDTTLPFSSWGILFYNLRDVEALPNGDIALGGELGGIVILDGKTLRKKRHLSVEDGLNSNVIYSLHLDANYNLWVGTDNGITVLDSTLHVRKNFYHSDGLSHREMNTKAVAESSNGYMFYGTLNGLTVFHADSFLQLPKTYGIAFDKLSIIRKKHIRNTPIPPNSQILYSLDSVALYFRSPDYYHYPYEHHFSVVALYTPYRRQWYHDASNPIALRIEDWGTHTLTVRANGYADAFVFQHRLDYMPFVWGTAGGLAIGLLSFFISRYIIRTNKKLAIQKTEFHRKIAELRLNALRARMNPHFIFNSLTAIQYFIHSKNFDKADYYLTHFALLTRLILDSSKDNEITLATELKILRLYLMLEKLRFREKIDFEIVTCENISEDIRIPSMIIQPFVENAIIHGITPLKDRKGFISLRFCMLSPNMLQCIIEDNGIGRKAAQRHRSKTHKPRGLQLVQERIDLINQASDMHIHLEIIDKEDKTGKAIGTKVVVTIHYLIKNPSS